MQYILTLKDKLFVLERSYKKYGVFYYFEALILKEEKVQKLIQHNSS